MSFPRALAQCEHNNHDQNLNWPTIKFSAPITVAPPTHSSNQVHKN